ncbi:SAF domain-containing protein [Rothia sp. 11254D007CT]
MMAQENLAPRFRKPGFRDPKLLAGVLIILLSVLGVVGLIRATNQTQPYYVASKDIGIGEKITTDNVTTAQVKLDESAGLYLSAEQVIADGSVATRPLAAGELLSPRSLSTEVSDGRRLVTLLLDQYAVAEYAPGNRVDIWVAYKTEGANSYGDPVVIAESAEVHSVTAQESVIGGTGRSAVELWVNQDVLPTVLGATSKGAVISLVPSAYAPGGN